MIVSYEGQSVHNSIVDALVAQEVERQMAVYRREEAARTVALLNEINRLHGMIDMREDRDRRTYAEKIADAELAYAIPRQSRLTGVLSACWWGLVGFTVEAFGALFDALERV